MVRTLIASCSGVVVAGSSWYRCLDCARPGQCEIRSTWPSSFEEEIFRDDRSQCMSLEAGIGLMEASVVVVGRGRRIRDSFCQYPEG
jgi:hypothetical protein